MEIKVNFKLICLFCFLYCFLLSCQKKEDDTKPKPNEKFIGNWVGNASRHKKDINNVHTYDTLYNQIVSIKSGGSDDRIIIWGCNSIVVGNIFNFSSYNTNTSITGSGELTDNGTQLHISKHDIVDFSNIGVYDQYWFEFDLHK